MDVVDEAEAEDYARWFRCLADPTRIRLLHLIARADQPVTVGQLVEQIGRSQSTVSRHLQLLADDEFIFTEADGIRTLVSVNRDCMSALPQAARRIMGVGNGTPA
ncbi:MAG: metalloregulator ArsR/SmtB family transcription factor [Acidimicrobiia bacterium]|nr:metalloregulator ArsR/SmtB family transcription factor [Acidimicrobiia bacterium]